MGRGDFALETIPGSHPKLSDKLKAIAPPAPSSRLADAQAHREALAAQGITPKFYASHSDAEVGAQAYKHQSAARVRKSNAEMKHFQALGIGSDPWSRFFSDLADAAIGAPAGAALAGESAYHDVGAIAHGHAPTHLYHDVGVPMGKSFEQSVEHPLRHPGFTALNALTVASVGAGAIGRVGALGSARAALAPLVKGDVEAAAEVPLTDRFRYWPKGVASHFSKTGELPKVNPAAIKAKIAQTVIRAPLPEERTITTPGGKVLHAPGSKNHLVNLIQRRIIDRNTEHALASGDELPGLVRGNRIFGAHVRAGRLTRAQARTEGDIAKGAGQEVGQYTATLPSKLTRNANKLTAAQEQAAWILSTGRHAEDWAKIHANGMENAEALSEKTGVPAKVIRENHEAKLHLTKMAAQYLDEHGNASHPLVKEAVEAMRRASLSREDLKGMDEEAVAHALGSRWYAAEHMLGGHDFHSELNELGGAAPEGPPRSYERVGHKLDIHERADQIHQMFVDKGRQLDGRAFYLPFKRESDALRARIAGTFQGKSRSQYGYSPPKGETTHALEGKLLQSGDYRTTASRLAAFAHSKAAYIKSQQDVHEMLLSLSHDTREATGAGKDAVPIRATSTIPPALRAQVNKIYEGGISSAEQAQHDSLAKALFDHWTKDVPDAKGVRYINPDVLRPLEPASLGSKMRLFSSLNHVVRSGRFLVPKYGMWLPQNLAIGLMSQGPFMVSNVIHYIDTIKKLAPETYAKIASGMGEGLSHAIEHAGTAGKLNNAIHPIANFWHRIDDHVPRMMQFVHEARREGFKTADDLEQLMNDPELKAKRQVIIQRANKEAIDYGALTPKERTTLNAVFAYFPWTRAASAWTFRFPLEHPIQADTYAQVGAEAHKRLDAFWKEHGGIVPPFLEGSLPTHAGPLDLSFLNPAETPASDLKDVAGLVQRASGGALGTGMEKYAPGIESQLLPLWKSALELATGQNSYGNPETVQQGLLKSFAPYEALTGGKDALERAAGSPVSGGTDYNSLAAEGASIERKSLRGVPQAVFSMQQDLRQLHALAPRMNLNAGALQSLEHAFRANGAYYVQMEIAAAVAGIHGNTPNDTAAKLGSQYSKRPDLYYLATVKAVPNVSPATVSATEKQLAAFMAQPTLTLQQKALYLKTAADTMWQKTGVWSALHAWKELTAKLGAG